MLEVGTNVPINVGSRNYNEWNKELHEANIAMSIKEETAKSVLCTEA